MDLTVQASSGIMSITGLPDGPPLRAGPSIVDFLGGIHLYAGVVTALYERTFTGIGRLVEVAMQETVYPSLASNLGFAYSSNGKVPPRVGNRHGGLAMAPYNVYPAKDGHVAIICVSEAHWLKLLTAMGREDLRTDPRFEINKKRVENLAETDAVVQAWTERLLRREIFERTKRNRIPSAPVRDLVEVMNDPHIHMRGMLEWFDDEDLGRIVLPTTPLMIHGADRVKTVASPHLGQDNKTFYSEWFGFSPEEIEALRQEGVI